MDLCSYINTLGETFNLTWVPGSELAVHHKKILGRVSHILRPTEAENQLPVVVYPQPNLNFHGGPGITAVGKKVGAAALPDVQLPPIRDTAVVLPEILDARVHRMGAERRIDATTKNEIGSRGKSNRSGCPNPVDEDQLQGEDEHHWHTDVTDTKAKKTSGANDDRGEPLRPYKTNQTAVESSPNYTPSTMTKFSDMVAAKVRLRLDLERLAQTVYTHSDTTQEVEPTLRSSQGLDGARDTLRKKLELLAQAARSRRGTANNAGGAPHPPPGLGTTPDTLRQNLECFAQLTPCHDGKATEHPVLSQKSSRTDSFGYIQKADPDSPAQTVWNDNQADTTPPADTDLKSNRNCFCCKPRPSKAPSLRPGQFWDDDESWIKAFDNKLANAPTTPELNTVYTCTPSKRPVDWQVDVSEASSFDLNRSENGDQSLNEEAPQVYWGSDRCCGDDTADEASGDGKLVAPRIVVDQVLGPGEEWDDEDDVEIVC